MNKTQLALETAAKLATVLRRVLDYLKRRVAKEKPPWRTQYDGRYIEAATEMAHIPDQLTHFTALNLDAAVRIVRLEEMKKPHPHQAEIDAASVEMLRGMTK